jgi:cell division protein FtsL
VAAPQRRVRYASLAERLVRERSKGRSVPKKAPERIPLRGARFWATFLLLAVPVLLMLGSVYVHTVATGLGGEVARLEEEKAKAEGEGERLEVRITELSEPGRIRTLARENLGMQEPGGKDISTRGSDGEDMVHGGGKKAEGTGE